MTVRLLSFLGSAALATVMISTIAVVLAWATWLESRWGTQAVQFGVYHSIWFAILLGLLGINVLAAAVVRFPWRKKQTGFLLVHAGILVLLIGCWMTWQDGIDGQMSLLEGDSSSTVVEPDLHFKLAIVSDRHSGNISSVHSDTALVDIPFRPGPFNWSDYDRLGWFPWLLTKRDCGVIYDRDGVKLEVLDYYADSRRVFVPELKLRVAHGPSPDKLDVESWKPVTLAVRSFGQNRMSPHGSTSVGAWRELEHGEIVFFRLAASKAETEAFIDSRPEGPLGRNGQVVIHADGKKFHFLVDDLKDKKPKTLGDTGLAVRLLEFNRRRLQVALEVLHAEGTGLQDMRRAGILVLHGLQSNLDRQDEKNKVYGSFWFDPEENGALEDGDAEPVSRPIRLAASRPRLDIIQGQDEQLYYRIWRAPCMGKTGLFPTDGSEMVVFDRRAFVPTSNSDKEETADNKKLVELLDEIVPATVYVESFTPSQYAGVEIRPLEFKKDGQKSQRAKVRLSIDGASREFWLANAAAPDDKDEQRRLVKGAPTDSDDSAGEELRDNARGAAIKLVNSTHKLGFSVVLNDFQRRLDPGTSRPAGYSSRIDFVGNDGSGKILEENVPVALNRPVDFTDPVDGRSYRFFQASFAGPYRPGDAEFDRTVSAGRNVDEVYRSVFSVASDPGRQLKYAGCLMIVAGIVVMYYMKAYFFRKKKRATS